MAQLVINEIIKGQSINGQEKDYEVIYDFKRRDCYYFKVSEELTGRKFDIGNGYGILKINADEIQEAVEMTGYYYIDEDGEKIITDEQSWNIEQIKDKKFYYKDNDEEVDWHGAYVDLFYEYYDGHNWRKIWLDTVGFYTEDVEDITEEIGKINLIGTNRGQTYNEYAYVNDKGKYYYKYSSFYNGSLDYLEETDLQTLDGMFDDLN